MKVALSIFADFAGTVALNGNYFSEFDWQWVRDGRNVPNCTANAIENDAPEWMMDSRDSLPSINSNKPHPYLYIYLEFR